MLDVGWREKIRLPELSKRMIKAKMDTGAKSSALHVSDLSIELEDGQEIANFTIWVGRKSKLTPIKLRVPVFTTMRIKSSNGSVEERPTIRTNLEINGRIWPINITLTDRSKMKYRMLIGRDAMADNLRVCPSKSYLLG